MNNSPFSLPQALTSCPQTFARWRYALRKLSGAGLLSIVAFIGSQPASAQEAASGLSACLDGNGNLFNVKTSGSIGEPCPEGTLGVLIGTVSGVQTGPSLTSKIEAGTAVIDIAPSFAIPPSCPEGQIVVTDDQGAWVCTPPPNLFRQPNPGARVWVVPHIQRCSKARQDSGGPLSRPAIRDQCEGSDGETIIGINNPGSKSIDVTALFFSEQGILQFDLTTARSIPAGGYREVHSPVLDYDSDVTYQWALITASAPILPTAWSEWVAYPVRSDLLKRAPGGSQTEMYPVDCDQPTGYEFVCQFVNHD